MYFLLLNINPTTFVIRNSIYAPFQSISIGEAFLDNKKIGNVHISEKEYQLFEISMLNYNDAIEINGVSYLYFKETKSFNYLHLNYFGDK